MGQEFVLCEYISEIQLKFFYQIDSSIIIEPVQGISNNVSVSHV